MKSHKVGVGKQIGARSASRYQRTRKHHVFEAVVVILFFAVSALANFPITGYQTASETTTAAITNTASVETVMLVNGGDKSIIDSAIAASISEGRGIPVLYTDHKDISPEVLSQFLSGQYKDVKNVVIIGGDSVISDSAQTSLEQIGDTAGYDVTRIAGVTATGTAVEAIGYFYGPEMLKTVTFVEYTHDGDPSQQEYLYLSAELGHPIIPIPSDLQGLPADVSQSINDLGIDGVTVVGDMQDSIKTEISDLGSNVEKEYTGTREEIKKILEGEIIESIASNEDIIFVEEGMVPPTLPGHKVFFYKDENNDNIDDETGSVLDAIGRGLLTNIKDKTGENPEIKFVSDDESIQTQFEEKLEQEGIKVEIGEAGDSIGTAVIFVKNEAEKIEAHFGQKQEDFQKLYEENKQYFEDKIPLAVDQFKAFYATLDKNALPPESLDLAAKIIDENKKGDALAQWQLMSAFSNSYKHDTYVKCDAACKQEYIESEISTVDQKLEKLVGAERAREVANLDKGKKIGLLGTDDFVPPTEEYIEQLRERYEKLIQEGTTAEQLREEFVKDYKNEAYDKYHDEIKQEYTIIKTGTDPAKWDDSRLQEEFERRLVHESEAYQAGLMQQAYFSDPSKRAEVFSTFTSIDTTMRNSGVADTAYLTSTEWKTAYDKYKSEGKLTADDIKGYEAATTAYKTYEYEHGGRYYDPEAGTYNAKTGQFQYVDPVSEALVAGSYNTDTKQYTYVNEQGELVQGSHDGEVHAYEQHELPVGYTYDNKAGSYVYKGTGPSYTYTPPAEYHEDSGTYKYEYVNPETGNTYSYSHDYYYTPPSPTNPESSNLAGSATYTPGTSYNPSTGTYVPTSTDTTSAGTTTTTVTTTDSSGATTSTSTYTGGSTGSYSGGTTTSGGTTDSGSYSAPSGDSGGGYSAPAPSGDTGGHSGGGEGH